METGLVSLGLALGGVSRSRVWGREGGRGGGRGGLLFMYLEGSWGIKAHPTPAARCVVFEGGLGRAEAGAGMRVWGLSQHWVLLKHLLCARCFTSTHCAWVRAFTHT